jgi:hypothetical protein
MKYCLDIHDYGTTLDPDDKWGYEQGLQVQDHSRNDSDYTTNPEACKCITGTRVSLNGIPVM